MLPITAEAAQVIRAVQSSPMEMARQDLCPAIHTHSLGRAELSFHTVSPILNKKIQLMTIYDSLQ